MIKTQLSMLKKENRLRAKSLTREDSKSIQEMLYYMDAGSLGEFDREMIQKELISLALVAQKNGEPLSTQLTDDYRELCDQLMESVGKASKKERILVVAKFVSFVAFIYAIFDMCVSDGMIYELKLWDIFDYICYPFLALLLIRVHRHHIFSSLWAKASVPLLFVAYMFISVKVRLLSWNIVLLNVNIGFLVLVTGIIFFTIYGVYVNYMEKQSVLYHWAD